MKALNRLDMMSFLRSIVKSKLIGSPPGYVGYDESGNITKLLPPTLYFVLFDEKKKLILKFLMFCFKY
jgi:ATP-dependent Clp protease ATP-binding subunit ClpC